jgi:hypothetical protein
MDTQDAFVERRRTAQRAGTIGLDNDPLIVALRQQWRDTEEVNARLLARKAAASTHQPKE